MNHSSVMFDFSLFLIEKKVGRRLDQTVLPHFLFSPLYFILWSLSGT